MSFSLLVIGPDAIVPIWVSHRSRKRLRGRAPPLCQFAVPGEHAQISDLIPFP